MRVFVLFLLLLLFFTKLVRGAADSDVNADANSDQAAELQHRQQTADTGANEGANDAGTKTEDGVNWKKYAVYGGAIVAGGTVAVVATPFVLGAAGFTAVGPAAGTVASWWMANLGAGAVFATAQSVAMAGLGAAGTVLTAAAGAVTAYGGVKAVEKATESKEPASEQAKTN